MPWFLEPVPVTSGIDWLVSLLRMAIADPKTSVNQVTWENSGLTSFGVIDETFYTTYLPIVSGADTYMRIGRWFYEEKDSIAGTFGIRGYTFNVESGAFFVPENAILGTSGDTIYLSYSWEEEQNYTYTDSELKLYIQDAVAEINNGYYDFGYTTSGAGSNFDLSPKPGINDVASYIYVKYATYSIKKRQEAEGFDNRIYVRDLNVTIDTAKGLGDLSKSADTLMGEIKDIIQTIQVDGQTGAMARIDTYSTYVAWDAEDNYAHRWVDNQDFF